MFGTHDLPLFIASGLMLSIMPGADSLFIVTRSASQGTRAGVAAALGIGVGCFIHVLAGALGLSAMLAASASAFTFIKLLGAAYLVFMGVALLRSRPAQQGPVAAVAIAPLRAIFAQGFLTNVLNPKVALFFLAFVPQFIDPAAPSKALSFVFLGAIFTFVGALWCLFLVWLAVRVGSRATGSRISVWFSRGVGAIFVFLGVRLALAERG